MSQENVRLAASIVDRWNGGELFVPGAYDPEIEWLPHRSGTEGAYRGIEDLGSKEAALEAAGLPGHGA